MNEPKKAFSLIELLVVVACIGIMVALSAPALVSIAQGGSMKRAIGLVSDTMELARIEAMASNSWVLVGFADTSEESAAVGVQTTVFVFATRDGTTNMAPDNLMPITRPLKLDNVKVLSEASQWGTNAEVLKGSPISFQAMLAGKPIQVTNQVLAFSPRGEAMVNPAVNHTWIEIPLREIRGTKELEEKTASVRVSGMSGQVIVDY